MNGPPYPLDSADPNSFAEGNGAMPANVALDADLFWQHVDQSGGANACWPWTLSVSRGGYGQVRGRDRKTYRAPRVAYELSLGPIQNGLTLDHTCHNPDTCVAPCLHTRCCNPAHLEPVTLAENIARTARSTCKRNHPKTAEHGRFRGLSGRKWRCVTCEVITQRERRRRRRGVMA